MDKNHGVEENGFIDHEDDEGGIIIPETNYALVNEHCYNYNRKLIHYIAESQNHGTELYGTIVHFITQTIEQKNHFICNDMHECTCHGCH